MILIQEQEGTSLEEKKRIRPLYNALQGYLKEAPDATNPNELLNDPSQWEYINATIDKLSNISDTNYNDHKINPNHNGYVWISTMKGKLGGLINYLHGKYFYDEPAPSSGNPSMVINQSQNQTASIVLVLELQKKIDEKLASTRNEKEKGFLKNLSGKLPNINNGVQLVKEVLDLCHQMGLDPHQVSKLFT